MKRRILESLRCGWSGWLWAAGVLVPSLACAQDAASVPRQVAGWLQDQDENADGAISRQEATGPLRENFDRIDRDSDGSLSRRELTGLATFLQRTQQQIRNRQGVSTEALRRQIPDDVRVVADIRYRDGDSDAWQLDLLHPAATSDALRPGLVIVHGGGWRNGDKRSGNFIRTAIEYAQTGYVCITVNYRHVDEAKLPACIEDVKCAVRWLRAHADDYQLDPRRIGGYGNSAGAHLVSMLGLAGEDADLEGDGPFQEQSSLLQAVCGSATPTDFLLFNDDPQRVGAPGGLFGGPVETALERARHASPVHHVDADAPPFLLIHGTADRTVNIEHARQLQAALEAAGTDVTVLQIEGAGHGVFTQHGDRTRPAMREFFDRTLAGSASPP